jgi:uncharacterized protein
MQCHIYRSRKRPGTYVYLLQRDDFACLPAALSAGLGQLEFSMEIELRPETRLATQDVGLVLKHLAELGYHVQFPPNEQLPSTD